MISQLFRTRLQSNLMPFVVFLALNVLSMVLLATHHAPDRPASADMYMFLTFWLLLFCLVAASLALLRNSREKATRLYAQLPVTSLQVRIAYWCHAGVYLAISTLVVALVMAYFSVSVPDILLFALLYFFHAGIWAALASIFASNKLRLIPDEIRQYTLLYLVLAAGITCLFVVAVALIFEGYAHVYGGRVPNWPLFTAVLGLLCAGLVVLDIRLFNRRDNYLG